MMYRLVLQKSIIVRGVKGVWHISRVSSDRVWICDGNNLILTNTAGDPLHRLTGIGCDWGGHTVNNDGDLIYIDSKYNINKLSTDNKVKTTFIKYTAPWEPRCVYSSPSTGDLLVGMFNTDTRTGKVVRYNSTGEHIQTIQYHTSQELYRLPSCITENRNGDVIVSDFLRVVVTERGGIHRFSYTAPPSGSVLLPRGICTDALSHILVCDNNTHSVQMFDCDGNFLSQLQTSPHGIYRPWGLSYDVNTHLLWVGSENNNTVNIYRVLYRDSLTDSSLRNMKCKKHPTNTAVKYCMNCDVPLCMECDISKKHIMHEVIEIQSRKDRLLENMKCKNHPTNTAVKFCVDCGVPLCVECMVSKEHRWHKIRDIQGIKDTDEEEKTGSDLTLKSIVHQQKQGEEQRTVPRDFESFTHKKYIGTKQITKESEEKIEIVRTHVKEEVSGSESSDELSDLSDDFNIHVPDIWHKSNLYQQKEIWKQIEIESRGKQIDIEKGGRIEEKEKTLLQTKLLSFDKKLKQLRKNGEAESRIQSLLNSLNIEQTHPQQYQRDQIDISEYEDIIQRVDYLDCSGFEFSNVEKQIKGFEPFSQVHNDDFFSWMVDCEEVFRNTQSAKCRSILSILFAVYTKDAITEFKPEKISLIIDHCMDFAIENENHILVLEFVRSYIFDFDFNLQTHFEGKKINSVVKDTILQASKCMILSQCPRLRQTAIGLSFCYECTQESRLVMMMSYKGSIEMKDGIPEKAMGVILVLYNYTQPSDEAYTVFKSFVASCSAINLPVITESDARKLFKKHSNLTLISASQFKSTGYSKGKHRVVKKQCISLLCLHKGYIPFGEREFPKQINGFEVDVQEGYCSLGSGRSIDIGGYIRRSNGINTPGNGSIGGFVDLLCDTHNPSRETLGLITCAHVVFSSDELKVPNTEINKYVLDNGTDLEVEVFDKTQHKFQVCGSIVNKCFPYLTKDNSVDAALIQLDPTVNEFAFPVTDQLYSAGFDPNKPPVFTGEVINVPDPDPLLKVSSRIPGILDSVIKYGSKTRFTIGNLYFNGAHIRFVDDTGNLPDKTIAVMCNQIEIQSLPHGTFFEPGDSGAFVFSINPDKTLSCIGMAIGSTTKGSCFVTPMTRILDSFGLPHILKPCPSISSEVTSRASENSSSSQLSQQGNASTELRLEAILLKLQMSITDVQNQQRNIQSSLHNVQTDVRNLKTKVGNLRTEVQAEFGNLRTEVQAEVGNLRMEVQTENENLRTQVQTEVGYLKAQVQEIKDEFQTRSSGSLPDINQN